MARFPTQTDLAFYRSKLEMPGWARALNTKPQVGQPSPIVMIDLVVNAHAGVRPTSGEIAVSNLLGILKSRRRRGENLVQGLRELSKEPGCLIHPEKRAAFARKWASRL
jgi:hypothetical protein